MADCVFEPVPVSLLCIQSSISSCSRILLIRDQQLKRRLRGSALSDVVQARVQEKKLSETENFELLQLIKSSLSFVWPILCSHFSTWGMLCVIVQRMTLQRACVLPKYNRHVKKRERDCTGLKSKVKKSLVPEKQ